MWPRVARIADGLNCLAEVAGNGSHRRKEQISEAMSADALAGREAILEEPRQQRFLFGERDDAVANVTRSREIELLPKPSAGAAVVADGDNRGQIRDAR